jgi:hypothetical protein
MRKWSWLLAPAIVIALAAAPAMAGNGKGKGGGSAAPSGVLSVDPGTPNYGDTVLFHANVSGVPSNADLLVALKCYQGNVWVYQLQEPLSSAFPLGGAGVSSPWTGGAAFCTADLFYFTYTAHTESGTVYVTKTTFNVGT